MRLGLVIRDGRDNPAARVRFLDLIARLDSAGYETRVLPWAPRTSSAVATSSARALALARWADVVVLQRPVQPPPLTAALARVNPHLVVDFDDAIWSDGRGGTYPRFDERLRAALKTARAVTAGSEHLARWARSVTSHTLVEVIRSSVDLAAVPERTEPDVPTIVWVGTPGNFGDFSGGALVALRELVATGRARMRIVSSEAMPRSMIETQHVAWREDTEMSALATSTIGVMPLRDDERSRGRCGYKAIQYMAARLPVVASPVGAGIELVHEGINGLLADGAGEWASALEQLLDDPAAAIEAGRQGHAWVNEHASTEVVVSQLDAVLRFAAG